MNTKKNNLCWNTRACTPTLSIAERNPEQERSWYRDEFAGSSGQRVHFSLREAYHIQQ